MNGKRISIVIIALMILAIGVVVVLKDANNDNYKLPVIEKAPFFELVNQNNQPVKLSDLSGKIKILTFIYVKCIMPKRCPLTTKNFRRIQESLLPELRDDTVIISITFDPESDTPEAMKRYGELYGADFTNWHFLTGSKKNIDKLCDDYQIIHDKQDDGITFRHSLITFLIDKDNNIRKMYFANSWQPTDVIQDIKKLYN